MSENLPETILEEVVKWREEGYEDVTDTTARLLNYWFEEDHLMDDGEKFEFRDCQREAVETMIYLYEVCEHRDLMSIQQSFDFDIPNYRATEDNWADYCFKMATGSGKTFVMAMAIVWQLFNSRNESLDSYSSNFLIISPNLIVLDRLKEGFVGDGENEESMFEEFPFFVPDEWESQFEFEAKLQSDPSDPHSDNVLHITNVQQFYERGSSNEEDNPVKNLMADKPMDDEYKDDHNLKEILDRYDDLVVLNDEAHHAHSETEWNEALKEVNENAAEISIQLDFTATAWDMAAGQEVLLPNIVYDYPLGRAIDNRIVKDPVISYIEDRPDIPSGDLIENYEPEINAAAQQLRDKEDKLSEVGEKPVLFVVCGQDDDHNPVENAERTADYFENELGFDEEEILTVHTYVSNRSKYGNRGDVKKDELERVREAAKNIDTNQYKVIVSVMMLQEGWDVNNVNVILPMRAFGSDVLVEQTLGRGLRRMFPNREDVEDRLDVIEHPSFVDVLENKVEENDWDIEIVEGPVDNESQRISVDEEKLEYDIDFPVMKGGISTSKPDIESFDLDNLPQEQMSLDEIEITEPKMVRRRLKNDEELDKKEIKFEFAKSEELYFSHMTRSILNSNQVPSGDFSELYPLVREYITEKFFEEQIENVDKEILKKLNSPVIRKRVVENFVEELKNISKLEKKFEISETYSISNADTFHTVRDTHKPKKSVFNKLPYDRGLEEDFMSYLDSRKEVESYTKIFTKIPLRINYFSDEGGLSYYVPDFIVSTEEFKYLVETKGDGFDQMSDVDKKAQAARKWCESASNHSEKEWVYLKITEDMFYSNRGQDLKTLAKISGDLDEENSSQEDSSDVGLTSRVRDLFSR